MARQLQRRMTVQGAIAAVLASAAGAATPTSQPAFPGAEGFGMYASGGRGGDVYAVTNLDDSGPGSLRDAVSRGNRTVVFKVSGTIELKSRLDVKQSNLTIAGQTAPGDGICLKDHEMIIGGENIVVRFLRMRPGDAAKKEMDALTIWAAKDVIVDHCSLSWSTDSLNDVVRESGNVTVQWCILAEPLVRSVHAKGEHGYATGWDGRTRGGMTGHHNLIAHAASRAPRVGYFKTGRGLIDVRNNVIYNSGPSYGGETDDFNYVGNYYRPGPNSAKLREPGVIFDIWSDDSRMYAAGNVVEGSDAVASNNAEAIRFKRTANTQPVNGLAPPKPGNAADCLVVKAFDVAPVTTESATAALASVTRHAGAWPRDAIDSRVIQDVKERTGKLINTPADAGGYPDLKSKPAPTDSDQDGIPDAWEAEHMLNPNDASDGNNTDASGYTMLEQYLNELAANLTK